MKTDYTKKAIEYAEKFGIINYKIVGCCIVYVINFCLYCDGTPASYRRKINLNNFALVENTKLKRVYKKGWENR